MTQPNNPDGPDLNLYRLGPTHTQIENFNEAIRAASGSLTNMGNSLRAAVQPLQNIFNVADDFTEPEDDSDSDDSETGLGFPVTPTEMI